MDRFKTYKFFAYLFSYPYTEEFFKTLEEFYPFEDKTPLEDLKKFPFGELQAEYTSLFEVKPGGVPCKPYQSIFEGEDQLMGNAAVDTAKYYNLFALDTGNEYPDRANLQLDFAAFLLKAIEQTPYAEDKKKLSALFREFFKRHISWMERLADCTKEHTRVEALKTFMDMFKEFLQRERELLKL